ncbi:MAG: hypothetical protein E6L02_07580 [Thaumarchaeota archaeon]|nr:MAG: hypothetical protein E6L02_07580 [Nitrososphaerota archaeon]
MPRVITISQTTVVWIAVIFVWTAFIIGLFFNAFNPQGFFPTGAKLPPTASSCDILSNLARLCIPSFQVPWFGGTLVFNLDLPIIFLTISTFLVGILILQKDALKGVRRR